MVVNTTLVVEEDPNQLIRWTSCTPSVELKRETGMPHARARSLASPSRDGAGRGGRVVSSRDVT